jgi:hypothetical protein
MRAINAGGMVMNLGYWLYMNEAEGYDSMVSTRLAKVNAVGRELKEKGYAGKVVPAMVFQAVCIRHGLDDVTQKEINHIEKEWL